MEVEDVCRICDRPSAKVFGVFDKSADGKQIINLIRETLPIVIYRKDPLSKVICQECLNGVKQVHAFRKSSLEVVDQQIRRLKDCASEEARLYLDIHNNAEQDELWMHSSPIKKKWDKPYEICAKCKIEIPKEIRPFRKYREASPKIVAVNGYIKEEPIEENVPKISLKRLYKASHTYDYFPKRPRIMGPKSVTQPFIRSYYTEIPVYNPLSLLGCCLNVINKQFVPEYKSVVSEESVEILETNEYICEYCSEEFASRDDLALHEVRHMRVKLDPVDAIQYWGPAIEEAECRNKWLRENFDGSDEWEEYNVKEEEESDDLLIPLEETDNEYKGEIELVDGKPMVNGVPLSEIAKLERRSYYNQNYNLNGVKRKFCPLCRYTFKDNWAIELHYFSSACYYTCRYCGIRFNKQRAQFDDHVSQHVKNGEKVTDKVFSARKKNDPVPKVLCDAKAARALLCTSPRPFAPKAKTVKVRHLQERNCGPPKTTLSAYIESGDKQNQAYFCRKCYKVFFKLDEFNNHVNNCTELPEDHQNDIPYIEEEVKYEPPKKYPKLTSSPTHSRSDESFSSTGRPIRNCVKDITYRDHLDIDIEPEEDEEVPTNNDVNFKGIECGLCNAVFPTIPSRNSHMRIHKNGFKFTPKGQIIYTQKPGQNSTSYQDNYAQDDYSQYDDMHAIKQEPLEPLVEIHESNSIHDIPSSIGSVSITPIPNKMQKTNINPDIMKLVQSNPNITIRSMHPTTPVEQPIADNSLDEGLRSYRCSSCAKTFSNKSNLYFHKKNQCEGSRYPCPFCKKRFGTEAAYSSHIFYSHPE